ncbi:GAF domain-containing sensor histidine kinase [Pseudonocardia asaccharolytica]|uniref:Histidine kinase n=1 Tax=Pseudonocardia asaccharolytica DSM 44247 = NBRC 16224 TaxID=1123024 RepID=A0A511D7V5_9PSEU|nr:GAF domain-containing protein [Pseudonocardia asaccharolytica]GEL20697.1 histidine kinase [Pseudonocardia asaccharolytica DSM 44247 = NBRC 16224]
MSSRHRAATERALDQQRLLDALLTERDGLLGVFDRVLALRGTARVLRDAVGVDVGFVADLSGPDEVVIRWLSGNRTDSLQDLVVPIGQGVGGRVLALGRPVRVSDYVSSASITHPRHFDTAVQAEALGAMLAVPIRDGSRTIAVAYASLRGPGQFGDRSVQTMEGIAAEAARALRLASLAEAGRQDAVSAERRRMQASLHDSVGAMLFSIGAQVRDLRSSLTDNPALGTRLGQLEADISAVSIALREALLALAESTPERALSVELAEHCRSFEARTGVPARLVQLGELPPLDAERTSLLTGVVGEGLLNVEKHAHPRTVIVSIGAVEGGVQVAVADDGDGLHGGGATESAESSELGLKMLAERATRLGGRLSLVHEEDGGATLRIMLPLPSEGGGSP